MNKLIAYVSNRPFSTATYGLAAAAGALAWKNRGKRSSLIGAGATLLLLALGAYMHRDEQALDPLYHGYSTQ